MDFGVHNPLGLIVAFGAAGASGPRCGVCAELENANSRAAQVANAQADRLLGFARELDLNCFERQGASDLLTGRLFAVVNLFPGVGHDDAALVREVHVIGAIFRARSADRDVITGLERVFIPAIGAMELAGTAELSFPTLHGTLIVFYVEGNHRMRIHELILDHRPGYSNGIRLVVTPGKTVVSKCRGRNKSKKCSAKQKRPNMVCHWDPPPVPGNFSFPPGTVNMVNDVAREGRVSINH